MTYERGTETVHNSGDNSYMPENNVILWIRSSRSLMISAHFDSAFLAMIRKTNRSEKKTKCISASLTKKLFPEAVNRWPRNTAAFHSSRLVRTR